MTSNETVEKRHVRNRQCGMPFRAHIFFGWMLSILFYVRFVDRKAKVFVQVKII